MENTIQEILLLVKKKMREQGAYDRDAYKQLIEETIVYFKERGKITDDENDEFIEDQLLDMYEVVHDGFARK
jgi:hypothetical protein